MAYTKTNWVNGYTPLNASNMNKIEEGIYNNDTFLSSLNVRVEDLEGKIGQGGIGSVVVNGNGNALTNVSYNPSTKILNFEKNNTFALDSDLDSVNDKNLYHLGAFDSVSGNTITRQTGYLNPEDIVNKNIILDTAFSNARFYFVVSDIESSITIPPFLVKWNLKGDDGSVLSNTTFTSICNYNGTIYIRINDNGDVINNLNDLKKYILSHNVSIQYKLATSYTEEIIEGQPLSTLDQSGSQWVREEWEKGLNLFDYNSVRRGGCYFFNSGEWNSSTEYIASDYISIKPNTTYSGNILGHICFYDNSKSYIGGVILQPNGNITTPSNAYFLRYSPNITTNNVMFNEGSHPYPYQEYNGAIVRESQAVKVKTFNGNTSTFNDFKTWMEQNSNNVISVIYYDYSSGNAYGKNVIFNIDDDVYKYINSEGTFDNVSLSNSSINEPDIIKVYYK